MPFKKIDMNAEKQELKDILESDSSAKKAAKIFNDEYDFRLMLAKVRKARAVTQKIIEEQSGLTQQVISRIENGSADDRSPTLRTIFRYLDAMDCKLVIAKREK